ncbi:hypothetical protein GCM10011581_42550 [Saccharopolyspora subtropica]|uniref:Methyltransferase type 11 domain-containing protein n=2 Tax=Saccharopolyspora thermophila TaxID=89367 RepID=A0A917K4L3_9PSEU|nr:hypothetical protein GCM10011581_42550 [Saccharopolyspora subtropica]
MLPHRAAHASRMTSDPAHGVRSSSVTCHYKRAGAAAPIEVLERFRVLAGKRSAGRVLDVGAFRIPDLLEHRHVCYLALVAAAPDVRDAHPDLPMDVVDADLTALPFPDHSFDVVVSRFCLCSTPDPQRAGHEFSRVLRPVGQLVFLEHTRAPGVVGQAQDQAQEILRGARRCRINIEVLAVLQRAGFVVRRADWYWPPTYVRAPLVQGVATHPEPQYERELSWLRNPIRNTGEPLWPGR